MTETSQKVPQLQVGTGQALSQNASRFDTLSPEGRAPIRPDADQMLEHPFIKPASIDNVPASHRFTDNGICEDAN